jgi:hypothetical protein
MAIKNPFYEEKSLEEFTPDLIQLCINHDCSLLEIKQDISAVYL